MRRLVLILVVFAFGISVVTAGNIEQYQAALKKEVTVNVSKSPSGGRLTAQYAVMEICKAAEVPYQWSKSQKLTENECRQYVEAVDVKSVSAAEVIRKVLTPIGLNFGVDSDGLYLTKEQDGQVCSGNICLPGAKEETEFFKGELNTSVAAEDFRLADLDGRIWQLDDFKGMILVVGRGMSWCAGCPPEAEELSGIQMGYEQRGVSFIYLNMGETFNTALDFSKYCRRRFPTLVCTSYNVPGTYQVGNPGIAVIDPSRNVRMSGNFCEVGHGRRLITRKLRELLIEFPSGKNVHKTPDSTDSEVKYPRVRDKSWTEPELVSVKGTKGYQPSTAALKDGSVIVAWVEDALKFGEIATRIFDGKEWNAADYPVKSEYDDYSPCLAAGPGGDVWLIWVSNRSGRYGIWASRYEGKGWQQPVMISKGLKDCFHPGAAINNKGQIWCTWYAWSIIKEGGTTYHWRSIYACSFDGDKWSEPRQVTPYEQICVDHWDPQISLDAENNPMICWSIDNRNDPTIFASSYADGNWSEGKIVSKAPKPQHAYHIPGRPFDFAPYSVNSQSGDILAFWQSNPMKGDGNWGIKCSKYNGTKWSEPREITGGRGHSCNPVAVVDGEGQATVFFTYLEQAGKCDIYYCSGMDNKWHKPEVLVEGDNNLNPAVCIDTSGRKWLIWQSSSEGNRHIYATYEDMR